MNTFVLSNDCKFFRITIDENKTLFHWDLPINFNENNYKSVSVKAMRIFPLKLSKRYAANTIHLNIIDPGLANPSQKIGFVMTDPIRRFFALSDTSES